MRMDERLGTGVEGFDGLVQGGFPAGTVNLVAGPAGSGKSLFALHFCYNGAREFGEPAMYVVLEETKGSLQRVLRTFGMDLEDLEESGKFLMIDLGELRVTGTESVSIGFQEVQDFLASALATAHVKRLVIDSVSAIGLHYPNPAEFRERLFAFARFLRERDVTSLLIAESPDNHALTAHGVEQFIADSVVHLGLEEVKGELRRTLTVRKMRFTKHDTAKHPMHITPSGLVVAADEKVV
jgi:KaiC/GvpD/RAD55 family RecA-like ATPase